MKGKSCVVLAMIFWAVSTAGAEINFGGGASCEVGNTTLSLVIPQVFVQGIYHVDTWLNFGMDVVVAGTPFQSSLFANGLSAGPEIFFAADASYHFPRVGPADLAVLVGGWGFQDYENRVNGVAAQTGLEATLHFGTIFVQGRGLYRFFSSTGLNQTPVPLGMFSFAVLGGYSWF
ncbi:MAG TPA: hypothetical protein VMU36_14090 [Spirochaetia bacterium]|nr:hypothetical protein [Spirochaetia bacterium]